MLSCVCLLHALGTGKPLAEYGQQTWQSDTGLPQNTVHAVVQARDGFLWVGTEAGLVRYDGVDFRVFDSSNTPALRSNIVNVITEDASGALWISTPGGLACERGGVFTAYGLKEGLPSATVLGAYLTHDGRLLVLTPAGAAELREGRFVLLAGTERLAMTEDASLVAEGPDAEGRERVWIAGPGSVVEAGVAAIPLPEVGPIAALAVGADGEVWVGGGRGIAVVGRPGQTRLTRHDGLPAEEVTGLLAGPSGEMWVGTAGGLALYEHGAIKTVPELAGQRVQRLFLDREGTLWVATAEGVARVTPGGVDFATRKPALGGVLSIFEDREGSMWFGTETDGLHQLREQAFSTVTMDDGLSASLVRAIFEDHAGSVWIGTSGGGLDRWRAGRAERFAGRLPSKVVLALAETGGAAGFDLWVGTPEGLARVRVDQTRGGQTRVFTTADGLGDDFVRSLYADRDGSLWIGTRNGLTHYKDGSFRTYSRADGLAGDLIGAILRRGGGELLVGTLGGLSRMKGDGFVDALPGVSGTAVTALLEDSRGTLWIGSNGSGLSRLKGGQLVSYPPAVTGLPATIYGMLEDAQGNLWLSSQKGVDRVSIADLSARTGDRMTVVHYGTADGMRINEASGGGHPAAWRARDGGLWFATLNGAAVAHPAGGLRNAVPPFTAIEQVLVEDQPAAAGGVPIRVGPGRGRLTIEYAGLSFVAPQKVRYRYMLEGFDRGWVEAGSRHTAFYTNVPPGSYRFLVTAANNDGVWSATPAEARFRVEPYFYQTGWFYALAALALGGLGYLVYRWRVVTVEAQYQAVLQERGRIAREIHDTLAQGYVAVSVQLELAERLLASSTEAAIAQLRATKELVRESLAEARSSIWNLRAQSDSETLPSKLAAYCTARRQSAGAVLRFTVHGTYRPLTVAVEDEVLRIAQEAVANAVAHAHAALIVVTLSYDTQSLELRVEDDGVGLKANAGETSLLGHFGLQGMRERAARIGAVLAVEGNRPAGTRVTLQVDVRRAGRKGSI